MQLEELSKQLEQLILKIDETREILARIEERQIRTSAMVEDVKEKEAPVVGSFATSTK